MAEPGTPAETAPPRGTRQRQHRLSLAGETLDQVDSLADHLAVIPEAVAGADEVYEAEKKRKHLESPSVKDFGECPCGPECDCSPPPQNQRNRRLSLAGEKLDKVDSLADHLAAIPEAVAGADEVYEAEKRRKSLESPPVIEFGDCPCGPECTCSPPPQDLEEEIEKPDKLEQTLGVIKPEAMPHVIEIFTLIRREGLAILKVRRVQLTAEQASEFFQDKYETPDFPEAVAHIYSGPIMAMVLSGPSAIDHWKRLTGPPAFKDRMKNPKCFRAKYGVPESDIKNGLHASASEADALRELHFFFPELTVEPIPAGSLAAYYLNENVHPVLTIGLSKLVRERPDDPVMWLADWLLANNPNKPKEYSQNGCQ